MTLFTTLSVLKIHVVRTIDEVARRLQERVDKNGGKNSK